MDTTILHASCISIDGKGVLLFGDSGSGKSDLALRMIDHGSALVSDDYVVITQNEQRLLASPPDNIKGMLELRGIGIITLPYVVNIPLTLAIQLCPREAVERLPEPQFFDCLGIRLPLLSLHAHDASTAAKIRLHLSHGA